MLRVMRKSSSSSSISNTRSASGRIVIAVRGQLYEVEPVMGQRPHRCDEPIARHRLVDEGVHAQVISADDVLLGPRRGERDHGDPSQDWVRLDLSQRLTSVLPRHVEVEQDQAWPRRLY